MQPHHSTKMIGRKVVAKSTVFFAARTKFKLKISVKTRIGEKMITTMIFGSCSFTFHYEELTSKLTIYIKSCTKYKWQNIKM